MSRASQFVDEQADGFLAGLADRGGEVDQVGIMADRQIDAGGAAVFEPGVDLLAAERRGGPLALVFGEHLHAVAAQVRRGEKGVVQAAGNGQVRSEHELGQAESDQVWLRSRMACISRITQSGASFSRRRIQLLAARYSCP